MKKFGILCVMALFAAIAFSSCQDGSSDQDKALAQKIENNEELSSSDYSHMIEYVGAYAEDAQKYLDMQINGDNLAEAKEGLAKLATDYPYVGVYRACIAAAPLNKFSTDDLEKIAKYAGLIEFTAPAGYTLPTAGPDAAGLEEAIPDSANGVIAGAVDTVQVKDF